MLDHGSLLGAARALGASQPTLGRHVAELEAQQLRIDTVEEYTRFSRACGQAEFAAVLAKAGIQQ